MAGIISQILNYIEHPLKVVKRSVPDLRILYNNLWSAENPTKKGFKGNRYWAFNTKVKYNKGHELAPYSKDGYQHDVAAGINVEALKASKKDSDRRLAKQAETAGLTLEQVDSMLYSKIKHNLAKVDEALTPYTNRPDTVSPLIKMGLADLRYQTGSLGGFKKLLNAVARGDLTAIRRESSVKANGRPDVRRQNMRNASYFFYRKGGGRIKIKSVKN